MEEKAAIRSVTPAKVTNINDMPRKMAEAFFVDAPTFLADETTEVDWLIPGMIPRGNIVLLSGEPSGGKSFIAYDLARAVCSQTPWMGRGPLCPDGPITTVILNYDNPTETLRTRVKKLGFTPEMPFHVHTLGYTKATGPNVPNILTIPEQASRLKYALDHLKPGLIIFDSFRQGQTLDENSSKDMATVMGILKTWTQIDRTTVIALHHTNKGGGAKQEWKSSARGSGEIIASAGVVCEVEPGKITWTKTQAWKISGTRTATFEITDSFSDAIADDDLDEDQTKVIRLVQRVNVKATSALPGEAEAESVKQIVDALAKAGREIVMFKDIPALVPNMKADVLKEALRNARQMHQLEYVRTPKGRGYRVAKKR